MSEIKMPRLIDLEEAAAIFRVSKHTVRSWIRGGRLHPLRICRRILFHPEEIARFIAEAN